MIACLGNVVFLLSLGDHESDQIGNRQKKNVDTSGFFTANN